MSDELPATDMTADRVEQTIAEWRRIAEAIKDPEDTLIVGGFPQLDAKVGSIAVFATTATMKKLQQAQRQDQPAQAASNGQ